MLNLIKSLFRNNNNKENQPRPVRLVTPNSKNDSRPSQMRQPNGSRQTHPNHQMRWGIVCFNGMPMVYTHPVRPENPVFTEWLCDLRSKHFLFCPQRDTASSLAVGLDQVLARPAKRAALILITDGNPTSGIEQCHKVIEDAAQKRVEVHTIAISEGRRSILEALCTEQQIGYGSYTTVQDMVGLKAAVLKALEGISEKPRTGGFHRCMFILDNSFTMNGRLPWDNVSKIEAICQVLLEIVDAHRLTLAKGVATAE